MQSTALTHAPFVQGDGQRSDGSAVFSHQHARFTTDSSPQWVDRTAECADFELQARVAAALAVSGYASLRMVECEVAATGVVLRGSVPSYHLKQLAQVFAQRIVGVRAVENQLEVNKL